jgi:hypothetical protein
MKIKEISPENMFIVLIGVMFVTILFVASFGSYLTYLSGKETRDLIREAISKNMTVENINYLVK